MQAANLSGLPSPCLSYDPSSHLHPPQDSPGAKMAYSAVVRVPAALTALMSAVPLGAESAGRRRRLFSPL